MNLRYNRDRPSYRDMDTYELIPILSVNMLKNLMFDDMNRNFWTYILCQGWFVMESSGNNLEPRFDECFLIVDSENPYDYPMDLTYDEREELAYQASKRNMDAEDYLEMFFPIITPIFCDDRIFNNREYATELLEEVRQSELEYSGKYKKHRYDGMTMFGKDYTYLKDMEDKYKIDFDSDFNIAEKVINILRGQIKFTSNRVSRIHGNTETKK